MLVESCYDDIKVLDDCLQGFHLAGPMAPRNL